MSDLLIQSCEEPVRIILQKALNGERISEKEALVLFKDAELASLSYVADTIRKRLNGNVLYFVKNYHIEPTNRCIHNCKFCSFSERISRTGWSFSFDEMMEMVRQLKADITELHIVGGVNPKYDLDFFCRLLEQIKKEKPEIHIKAFTAVELDYIITQSGLTFEEGLKRLKVSGLDSVPGGGAEIFNPEIRKQICSSKTGAKDWLKIHEIAHQCGIPSNATILYGFFETYEDRVDHLSQLRKLQDKTKGFNAFIPLKFKNKNNEFSHVPELSVVEEMKNYAVSRIFLDNIQHLKVYWPMTGLENSRVSLHFGVDDFDGTIDDSTRIYEMAGSMENPTLNSAEIEKIALEEGLQAVERDGAYNEL